MNFIHIPFLFLLANCSFINKKTLNALKTPEIPYQARQFPGFLSSEELQEDMILLEELFKYFIPSPTSYPMEIQRLLLVTEKLSLTELSDLRRAIVSHASILESFEGIFYFTEIKLLLKSIDLYYQKGLHDRISTQEQFEGLSMGFYEQLDLSFVSFQPKYMNNKVGHEPYIIPMIRKEFLTGLIALKLNRKIIRLHPNNAIFQKISSKRFNEILNVSTRKFSSNLLPQDARLSTLANNWESKKNTISFPELEDSYFSDILTFFVNSAPFGQLPTISSDFSPKEIQYAFYKHYCMIIRQLQAHERRRSVFGRFMGAYLNYLLVTQLFTTADLLIRSGAILSYVYCLNYKLLQSITNNLQVIVKDLYKNPSELDNYPIFDIQMPKYSTLDINNLFGRKIDFSPLFTIIVEQKIFELIAAYYSTPALSQIACQNIVSFLLKISSDFKSEGVDMKIIIAQFKFLFYSLRIYKRIFNFKNLMIKWGLYAMVLLDMRALRVRKELFEELAFEVSHMYPEEYKNSGFELIGALIKYEKF
jgi:hypothetical protein